MASASAILPKERYDVFISFRCADTRENFTSHLHAALIRRKIETYIDYRLEKGEELEPALLKAIEESKVYVIIFSENYASSTWCLKELAYILECKARYERYVIPVFYGIDPSAVRNQKKSYETAFAEHEQRLGLTDEVLKWKGALTKAANLSGFDSTSRTFRDDSDIVEQVVSDVLAKLYREPTGNVPDNLVGVEARIQSIIRELDIIPEDRRVRFVVIWGMGGIGKTTLADVVFHGLSSQFEACCFIANVRERSGAKRGFSPQLKDLRDELLRQLLGDKDIAIRTPSVERLKHTKVLVVLDDVNHSSQLEVLAGDQVPFGPGSRVVITARDSKSVSELQLLRKVANWDVKTYEVEKLHVAESKQFFLSKSLINSTKNSKFLDRVLHYTAGVPLALKVLSLLFLQCKRQEDLELLWEKLRKFPSKELHNVYRASYEGLERNEREIFLDIACFHKGEELRDTKRILAACGLFPDDGIEILINMSLISLKDNRIWMHDVIQEMGVDIVKEECAEEPGNRSRLHNLEDVSHVLKNNMGTANVRSICPTNYGYSHILICPQAFIGMHNLSFLKLRSLKFEDEAHLESLPNALRYLDWSFCPLKSLPSNFCSTNLVELHMPESELLRFWLRGQNLKNLKVIDLSYSEALVEVGDLSNCVNIETINLSGCESLVKVSDLSNCKKLKSIDVGYCTSLVEVGDLFNCVNVETIDLSECKSLVKMSELFNCKKLKSIDLKYCTRLVEVPDLSKSLSIERLSLEGCSSLDQIPPYIHQFTKLTHLNLDYSKIESVPSSIESLTGIESLRLRKCRRLVSLPTNICKLKSLRDLDLSYCENFTNFPEILEPMEHLENIDLSETNFEELPSSFGNLVGLKTLNLSSCWSLREIPNCFDSLLALQELDLSETMIQTIPPTIKHVSGLRSLTVNWCKRLRSLPVLPCLLEELTVKWCDSLKRMAASVTAHTQGLNQINSGNRIRREILDFYPCISLDKEARRNIMDDAYHRIMRIATARNLGYLSFGEIQVICEDTEIPKWFSYQTEGSSMNIKLPLHWFDSNLLGFALCIVTGTERHAQNHTRYKYKMMLKTKDGVGHSTFDSRVSRYFKGGMIVWYSEVAAVSDEAKESTEAYFEVYSEEHANNVKRCGVCFLYPPGQDDNALKFEVFHPQQVARRRIEDEARVGAFGLLQSLADGLKWSQLPGECNSENRLQPVLSDSALFMGDFEAFGSTRDVMDKVMKALQKDEISIIGVFGRGGVGKTTMVEHVSHQVQSQGLFDDVIKAVITQTADLRRIQGTLADLLGIQLEEESEYGRSRRLMQKIREGHKILIILEDLWEKIDLTNIGIPRCFELQRCSSKVLLTTRSLKVGHSMSQATIHLDSLSEEDSWNLFLKKSGRTFEKSTEMYDIARMIARQCAGLPVSLIAVANALGDKYLDEWNEAARRLKQSPPASHEELGDVFKCIKLSYDYLRSDDAKSCFLLCCLFPEHSDILIEDLLKYGMGKGLFGNSDTVQKARDNVYSTVEFLKTRNLLLETEQAGCIRMHNVVREVAILISTSEDGPLFVKAQCQLKEWPEISEHEGYSAISLMRNKICKLPEKLVCSKLRLLFLQSNFCLNEIPKDFFGSLIELRVLDLSQTRISSLPPSLNLLINLHTLYLDGCFSAINNISILGNLKKLEILSMRELPLVEVPKEIGKLASLRMLDLTGEYADIVPSKVISNLHRLEELYMQCNFAYWGSKVERNVVKVSQVKGSEEEIMATFDELTGLSNLNILKVFICDANSLPESVEIEPNWVSFDICISRDPLIRKLTLVSENSSPAYSTALTLDTTINILPGWFIEVVTRKAQKLQYVNSWGLNNILTEHDSGKLDAVKYLSVTGPNESLEVLMSTVTWVPKEPVFESLEELHLVQLDCLKELCVGELPPESLRNLRLLNVKDCYELVNALLPSRLLQRLQNLEKVFCEEMDELEYVFGCEGIEPEDVILKKLIEMRLENLGKLINIWDGPAPRGIFGNLQTLVVLGCFELKNLFTAEVAHHLVQLEDLSVVFCLMLDSVIEASKEALNIVFPKLKKLALIKLPQLSRFCSSTGSVIHCHSLEYMYVERCPQFSPPDFHSKNKVHLNHQKHMDILLSRLSNKALAD